MTAYSNLTPPEVIETLAAIGKDIDDGTDDIALRDEEAVRARVAYQVAYARSFLSNEGSMDVRKQQAVLDCADLLLAHEIAEQQQRAAVSHVKALRDRLEIGRSISALVRLEWQS